MTAKMNQTMRMANFIGSKGIDWAEFFGKNVGPFSPLDGPAIILKKGLEIGWDGKSGCKLWRIEIDGIEMEMEGMGGYCSGKMLKNGNGMGMKDYSLIILIKNVDKILSEMV
jgi:hypothetical protein